MLKNYKSQRTLWFCIGICFLSAFVINILEGQKSPLLYIFSAIAIIASFLNAYLSHKKIIKE